MPQKFVNLENLTSFWGNAKEYIGNERKEIEDQLYNWQKTEKAPMVQCEPVPNSELHPVVNFSFTETLPAEGEKGPSNPSTITGTESINVTHSSVNLATLSGMQSSVMGVSISVDTDGTITLNGTHTGGVNNRSWIVLSLPTPFFRYPGQYLHLRREVVSGSFSTTGERNYVLLEWPEQKLSSGENVYRFIQTDSSLTTAAATETYKTTNYNISIYGGQTFNNYKIKVMIEVSDSPIMSSYVPAKTTNHTIYFNDTYYGGFIDFFTGLMTVTWHGIVFDGTENWSPHPTIANCYQLGLLKKHFDNGTGFSCTHFPKKTSSIDTGCYITQGYCYLYGNYTDVTDLKAFLAAQALAGTPVTIIYTLLSSYIFDVQFTSTQIKSLPSLEGTSKRINTIYTDADSVQVEYQKYVGIDSTLDSNSVNAIQNKVVNSALNTKVSLSGDETINGTKTFSNAINGNITGDAGTVAGHIVSKDVPVNAAFTDTTYDPATQSTAGLMSASDKVKLDAVGSVFSFKGSVIDDTYLPASDNANGDAYLAEDTGHVHVYDGTDFVDIGTWTGIPSATDAQIDALFED